MTLETLLKTAVFISACATGASAALACEGSSVLFQDQFKTLDPAWPAIYGGIKADEGHMKLFVPPGDYSQSTFGFRTLNQNNVYNDAVICATVTLKPSEDQNNKSIGLAFWAISDNSYYTFLISDGSYTAIHRLSDTRMLSPISWTASPNIPKALDKPIELQVITRGDTASFYVDKQKIADIKGQLPADGQLVGINVTMTTKDKGDQFFVDDFQVKK